MLISRRCALICSWKVQSKRGTSPTSANPALSVTAPFGCSQSERRLRPQVRLYSLPPLSCTNTDTLYTGYSITLDRLMHIKSQSLNLKMYKWGFRKYSTKCSVIICVDVSHLFSVRVDSSGHWLLAICSKTWKEKHTNGSQLFIQDSNYVVDICFSSQNALLWKIPQALETNIKKWIQIK